MEVDRFEEDPRFTQSGKEALMGLGLFALNVLWWYGFAYGLGARPPEEYAYVMGFPAWFFYSCILGVPVFSFLAAVMVKFMFKEISIDAKCEKRIGGA